MKRLYLLENTKTGLFSGSIHDDNDGKYAVADPVDARHFRSEKKAAKALKDHRNDRHEWCRWDDRWKITPFALVKV